MAGFQWQELLLTWPLMYYVAAVFVVCWAAVSQGASMSFVLLLAYLFLYKVESKQRSRVKREIRCEERRNADKRRLGDEETVAWLNLSLEKIWPICLQRFSSQEILMPLTPWFLDKYKPWTAKKVVLHHLNLGSRPPHFTSISVNEKPAEGYTMVLDVKMNFVAAQDMSAVLAVQLRGLGLWTTFHLSNLQLLGKVRVGVKLIPEFPFVERVGLCFEEAPHLELTVRPVFNYGVDVSEIPGVANWLDKMLADAMEDSLVEPNMMVIDVGKLVESFMPFRGIGKTGAPFRPDWFYKEQKRPIAIVYMEIVEAKNLKPSDPNGLADPFVKGAMGLSRFKTKIKHKTLAPVWNADFRLPVFSWDLPNLLVLRVRDKDRFHDDELGYSVLPIANFRGGERHLKWLPLRGGKMGKLLVAVTVDEKVLSEETPNETTFLYVQSVGGTEVQQLQSSHMEAGKGSQSYLAECLQKGIDLADPGPDISGDSESEEYEDINFERGQGGMLSILRSRTKKKKKKKKHNKRPGNVEDAEAVAKRQYLAGDGLWDRSIRRLTGVQLNIDESDSEIEDLISASELTRRKKGFWKSRPGKGGQHKRIVQQDAGPDRPLEGPEEMKAVGNLGTEVTMRLEPSEEHLGKVNLHRQDPVELEDYGESGSKPGHEKQRQYLGGPMKKFGKGFMHHVGKSAHQLHHAKEHMHHVMNMRRSTGRGGGSPSRSPRVSFSTQQKDSDVTCGTGSEEYAEDPADGNGQMCTVAFDNSPPLSPRDTQFGSVQENNANQATLALGRSEDPADLDQQMHTVVSERSSRES